MLSPAARSLNGARIRSSRPASETVGRASGALQVHARPALPTSDCRPLERREHRGRLKPAGTEFADGETRTIHGNALARREIVERSTNAKLAPDIRLPHALDFANLLDQSGKHSTLAQRVPGHHIFAKLGAPHHTGAPQLLFQRVGQLVERAQPARTKCDR